MAGEPSIPWPAGTAPTTATLGACSNSRAADAWGSIVIALLVGLLGLLLYLTGLWDGFQLLVLPGPVGRGFRVSHPFFRFTRTFSLQLVGPVRAVWPDSRPGCYGPASLLVLIAVWAVS